MPKLFDVNDVAAQVDVIRRRLREWYAMHGPVPGDLAEDHDMGWSAREADRLAAEADAAELRAKSLAEFEARNKDGQPAVKSAAEQAADAAKAARAAADEAKASASSVSMQKWGENTPRGRDPNAPKAGYLAEDKPSNGNGKPDLKPVA